MSRRIVLSLGFCLVWLLARPAQALTHIVRHGETLASIAETYYARIFYERILVTANRLDLSGGTPLTVGMRLEIPTVAHYEVKKGETWPDLATRFLGAPARAEVLSRVNDSNPWLIPEEGVRILIPYNLSVLIGSDDTIVSVAQRFLGDAKQAWTLTHYNALKEATLTRGQVILVPLSDLPLTEAALGSLRETDKLLTTVDPEPRLNQRRLAAELPTLLADVRSGRYVDAIARGNRLLGASVLSVPQEATVQRQLLEAYVALDATGLGVAACVAWRKLLPTASIDPNQLSPKILEVCKSPTP